MNHEYSMLGLTVFCRNQSLPNVFVVGWISRLIRLQGEVRRCDISAPKKESFLSFTQIHPGSVLKRESTLRRFLKKVQFHTRRK